MAAGEKAGAYTLIKVNTGTNADPVWTAVARLQGTDFAKSPQLADVGGVEEWPYNEGELVGMSEVVTLTGVYVASDVAIAALDSASENGDQIRVQEYRNGVASRYFDGKVTGFNHSHPKNDRAGYTITIQRETDWTAS